MVGIIGKSLGEKRQFVTKEIQISQGREIIQENKRLNELRENKFTRSFIAEEISLAAYGTQS